MFVDVKISWKLEVNSLAVTQHAVVRAALLVIGGVSLFFFFFFFFLFVLDTESSNCSRFQGAPHPTSECLESLTYL